jgi:hypothetical protein
MKDPEEELSFLSEKELNDHMEQDYREAVPIGSPLKNQMTTGINEISFIKKSAHPTAAIFHLLFKTIALVVYLFGGIFTTNYVFLAVMVILLLAFDFWTVKNVTGRLLVGLRWWNYVREDGSNEWIFESLEDLSEINDNDSRVFWVGLYLPVAIWGLLFFYGVLTLNLQWLVIIAVALSMHMANIIGYTKCSNDAKQKMQNIIDQGSAGLGVMSAFGQSSAFRSALSGLVGTMVNSNSPGGANDDGAVVV